MSRGGIDLTGDAQENPAHEAQDVVVHVRGSPHDDEDSNDDDGNDDAVAFDGSTDISGTASTPGP